MVQAGERFDRYPMGKIDQTYMWKVCSRLATAGPDWPLLVLDLPTAWHKSHDQYQIVGACMCEWECGLHGRMLLHSGSAGF